MVAHAYVTFIRRPVLVGHLSSVSTWNEHFISIHVTVFIQMSLLDALICTQLSTTYSSIILFNLQSILTFSLLPRYNPAIMDEERVDRCVTKQKKTFSFSIDRILNRDNVKQEDPRRGSHSTLLCCSSPHCREDKAVDTISTRPLQAYQSAFVACQHPICALPTNSRIHTDPYHDFHSPRSYHKYLGLTSVSPRTVCHGDYVRMKETIPYGKRLLMYSRDAGVYSRF